MDSSMSSIYIQNDERCSSPELFTSTPQMPLNVVKKKRSDKIDTGNKLRPGSKAFQFPSPRGVCSKEKKISQTIKQCNHNNDTNSFGSLNTFPANGSVQNSNDSLCSVPETPMEGVTVTNTNKSSTKNAAPNIMKPDVKERKECPAADALESISDMQGNNHQVKKLKTLLKKKNNSQLLRENGLNKKEPWVGCSMLGELVHSLTKACAVQRWRDALALLPCIALRSYPVIPLDYTTEITSVLLTSGILQGSGALRTLQYAVPSQTLQLLSAIVQQQDARRCGNTSSEQQAAVEQRLGCRSQLEQLVDMEEVLSKVYSRISTEGIAEPRDSTAANAYRGLISYMRWKADQDRAEMEAFVSPAVDVWASDSSWDYGEPDSQQDFLVASSLSSDSKAASKVTGGFNKKLHNSPATDAAYRTAAGIDNDAECTNGTRGVTGSSAGSGDPRLLTDGHSAAPRSSAEVSTQRHAEQATVQLLAAVEAAVAPCEWLLRPLLESMEISRGSAAVRSLLRRYLSTHRHHVPSFLVALQHVRAHWPLNTAEHVAIMKNIQRRSEGDDVVLILAQTLLDNPAAYCAKDAVFEDEDEATAGEDSRAPVSRASLPDCEDELYCSLMADSAQRDQEEAIIAANGGPKSTSETVQSQPGNRCLLQKDFVVESIVYTVKVLVRLLHFRHWQDVLRPWELLNRALTKLYAAWIRCWNCRGCRWSRYTVVSYVSFWWQIWWRRYNNSRDSDCKTADTLETDTDAKLVLHRAVVAHVVCVGNNLCDWWHMLNSGSWTVLASELRDSIKRAGPYRDHFKLYRRRVLARRANLCSEQQLTCHSSLPVDITVNMSGLVDDSILVADASYLQQRQAVTANQTLNVVNDREASSRHGRQDGDQRSVGEGMDAPRETFTSQSFITCSNDGGCDNITGFEQTQGNSMTDEQKKSLEFRLQGPTCVRESTEVARWGACTDSPGRELDKEKEAHSSYLQNLRASLVSPLICRFAAITSDQSDVERQESVSKRVHKKKLKRKTKKSQLNRKKTTSVNSVSETEVSSNNRPCISKCLPFDGMEHSSDTEGAPATDSAVSPDKSFTADTGRRTPHLQSQSGDSAVYTRKEIDVFCNSNYDVGTDKPIALMAKPIKTRKNKLNAMDRCSDKENISDNDTCTVKTPYHKVNKGRKTTKSSLPPFPESVHIFNTPIPPHPVWGRREENDDGANPDETPYQFPYISQAVSLLSQGITCGQSVSEENESMGLNVVPDELELSAIVHDETVFDGSTIAGSVSSNAVLELPAIVPDETAFDGSMEAGSLSSNAVPELPAIVPDESVFDGSMEAGSLSSNAELELPAIVPDETVFDGSMEAGSLSSNAELELPAIIPDESVFDASTVEGSVSSNVALERDLPSVEGVVCRKASADEMQSVERRLSYGSVGRMSSSPDCIPASVEQIRHSRATSVEPIRHSSLDCVKQISFSSVEQSRQSPVEPIRQSPVASVEQVRHSPVAPVQPISHSPVAPVEPISHSSVSSVEPISHSPVAPVEPFRNSPVAPVEPISHSSTGPVEPISHSSVGIAITNDGDKMRSDKEKLFSTVSETDTCLKRSIQDAETVLFSMDCSSDVSTSSVDISNFNERYYQYCKQPDLLNAKRNKNAIQTGNPLGFEKTKLSRQQAQVKDSVETKLHSGFGKRKALKKTEIKQKKNHKSAVQMEKHSELEAIIPIGQLSDTSEQRDESAAHSKSDRLLLLENSITDAHISRKQDNSTGANISLKNSVRNRNPVNKERLSSSENHTSDKYVEESDTMIVYEKILKPASARKVLKRKSGTTDHDTATMQKLRELSYLYCEEAEPARGEETSPPHKTATRHSAELPPYVSKRRTKATQREQVEDGTITQQQQQEDGTITQQQQLEDGTITQQQQQEVRNKLTAKQKNKKRERNPVAKPDFKPPKKSKVSKKTKRKSNDISDSDSKLLIADFMATINKQMASVNKLVP